VGVNSFTLPGNANATSNAETVKGAMAQALSTAVQGAFTPLAPGGQATSTAKTSLAGVSVQSKNAVALGDPLVGNSLTATTDAIAQGGSGQTLVDPGETAAIGVAAGEDKRCDHDRDAEPHWRFPTHWSRPVGRSFGRCAGEVGHHTLRRLEQRTLNFNSEGPSGTTRLG
jgi:hypothetical protein